MATIEKRVERLERRNRWLTGVCGIVLLTALIAWTAESTNAPDVVQAERFQLLDESGSVRGELLMDEDGPALALLDENGNRRIDLYHHSEATALYIQDAEGQPRVGAAEFAHGGGGFALHGPGGVGTSVLYMQGMGLGHLAFYDSTGSVVHRFPPSD